MKLAKLLFGVALCSLSIGFGVFGSAAKSKSKKIPLEIMVNFTAEVKVYQSNNIEKEVCFLMTIISSFQEKLFAVGLGSLAMKFPVYLLLLSAFCSLDAI